MAARSTFIPSQTPSLFLQKAFTYMRAFLCLFVSAYTQAKREINMGRRYNFKTSSGSSILPTTSGDYFTDNLDPSYNDGQVYLEFYGSADDARNLANAVTPTGGTIVVNGSPLGNVFIRDSGSETISASAVSAPNGTYTPPIISGAAVQARVTLSGITGATHCRIVIDRSES